MPAKLTKEEFIRRAKIKHGQLYVYRNIDYVDTSTKISIECKTHGNFTQEPRAHLAGQGCPKCGLKKLSNALSSDTETFIVSARKVHGRIYDYKESAYKSADKKIKILCKLHGVFNQTPASHLRGSGCPSCSERRMLTTEEFVKKAQKKFGRKFDYSKTEYAGSLRKAEFICRTHGSFWQTPSVHLECKEPCAKCSHEARKPKLKEVLKEAKRVHENLYGYNNVTELDTLKDFVKIECKSHGVFKQRMNLHLRGAGCKICGNRGHSKISIKWIKEEAKARNMKGVIHAGNGHEYKLPGTKFRVDGYHPTTKTVFEFHGDCFHGNPKVYKPRSKPHPFSDKTASQLFKETLERERKIRDMGYRLITIWEHDYRNR